MFLMCIFGDGDDARVGPGNLLPESKQAGYKLR